MSLGNIPQMGTSRWKAADHLCAISKVILGEYCMPVLGVIVLIHASNRYDVAMRADEADQVAGKIPKLRAA